VVVFGRLISVELWSSTVRVKCYRQQNHKSFVACILLIRWSNLPRWSGRSVVSSAVGRSCGDRSSRSGRSGGHQGVVVVGRYGSCFGALVGHCCRGFGRVVGLVGLVIVA
jgi:hypothetical protein